MISRAPLTWPVCFCVLFALTACEPAPAEVQARGHVLQLSAAPFQAVAEIGYTTPEGGYVVRPRSDGGVLLLTKISAINANAALASLLIDEHAMSVEDARGRRYNIVNPWGAIASVAGSCSSCPPIRPCARCCGIRSRPYGCLFPIIRPARRQAHG